MRLLLVTHGVKDTTTAVYRNTLGRARFLEQLGHDVHVLTPADVGLEHYARLVPVLYPLVVTWWILRHAPFHVIKFHSHTGWAYVLLKPLVPTQRGTQVVVAFHGLDVLYVRALAKDAERRGLRQTRRFRLLHQHVLPRITRWTCRRAARVFYMNRSERRFLLDERWADEHRLRWMPNCVSPGDFVERDGTSGPVRLLTMAQWLPVKGTDDLVEAFTALVRRGVDITLTCSGARLPPERVRRDFPEDVRARVTVVPVVPHEEVGRFYASADIFVLPSIFEGFSIALLEAMAAGLAIVATDAGAASEILEAGRDAAIVPVANAGALASSIEALAGDPIRRRDFGSRARARAAAFTCDRVLPRFAADLLDSAEDAGLLAAV